MARVSSCSEREARSSDGFRLRVGLFQVLEPDVRSRILEARSGFLRGQSAHLTAVQTNFQLDRYAEQVTSQFLSQIQAELDWIERLRRIEKSRKEDSHE